MNNGGLNPEYAGRREEEESRGLLDTSAADEKKRREIQFKAIHGLLIAFFIWIL